MNRFGRKGIIALAAAGLGGAILLVAVLASPGGRPRPMESDPEARLRWRMEIVCSQMEQGDAGRAEASIRRIVSEERHHGSLVSLLESMLCIAHDLRLYPHPEFWDWSEMISRWGEVAEHPLSTPRLRRLATRKRDHLVRERDAASRLAKLASAPTPLEAMRVRGEILKSRPDALTTLRDRPRLERVRDEYESALRQDLATLLAHDEPGWERILGSLKEAGEFGLDKSFDTEAIQGRCRAGIQDRTALEKALDAFDKGDLSGSLDLLSKIGTGSHYWSLAERAATSVRLHVKFQDAADKYDRGELAGAAQILEDLLRVWPAEERGRDVLTELAKAIPRLSSAYEKAEKLRETRDFVAARRTYLDLLADKKWIGTWHRRNALRGLRECEEAIAGILKRSVDEFSVALEADRWSTCVRLMREVTALDEMGTVTPKMRKLIMPRAPAIVAEIEKRCWRKTLTETDLAAALLLESLLGTSDPSVAKLVQMKKTYRELFEGNRP